MQPPDRSRHARQVEQRPDPADRPAELAQPQAGNQRLGEQLAAARRPAEHAVPCDAAKLQRVATVAGAAGVSLGRIEQVLAAFLPTGKAPDHSTITRRVAHQAAQAQAILPPLDAACVPLGQQDGRRRGLFWGRPTLVGTEPTSTTAVSCRKASDRSEASWHGQLAPFEALEFVLSDAAKGIASGLSRLVEQRHPAGEVAQSKRRGIDGQGGAQAAAAAWRGAPGTLHRVERPEAAWRRAREALDLFDCSGRLNSRGRAEVAIAAALPELSGWERRRVSNFLRDPRGTAFLDRMLQELG